MLIRLGHPLEVFANLTMGHIPNLFNMKGARPRKPSRFRCPDFFFDGLRIDEINQGRSRHTMADTIALPPPAASTSLRWLQI